MKALEKDPEQRFGSAREVSQALGYQSQVIIPSPPHLKVAYIVVMQGSEAGQRFMLGPEATVLGREQIAPRNLQVSRHHMSITPRGDQLWLEDTSLNGTWVNGERIFGEIPIKVGDEIVVGNCVLRVEW
jgi:hypothetical protein